MQSSTRRKSFLERNKLFATTPISPFNFVQNANKPWEIVFWYSLTIVLVIITIYGTISLVIQFNSDETVTKVSVGRGKANLKKFHFCLKFKLPELNPEYSDANTVLEGKKESMQIYDRQIEELERQFEEAKAQWLAAYNTTLPPEQIAYFNQAKQQIEFHRDNYKSYFTTETDNPVSSVSLKAQVDDVLRKLNSKEKFLDEKWNYTVIPLLHHYYSFISRKELGGESEKDDTSNWFDPSHSSSAHIASKRITKLQSYALRIRKQALDLGVTDQQLLTKLGKEVLNLLDTKVKIRYGRNADYITLDATVDFFSGQGTVSLHDGHQLSCYSVFLGNSSESQLEEIALDLGTLGFTELLATHYNMPLEQMNKTVLSSKPSIQIFFSSHPDPNNGIQPDQVVVVGEPKRISLKIANHFQLIKSCSKIPTNQQCLVQCRALSISEQCGCRPLLFGRSTRENFSSNVELCKLEGYQRCQLKNADCSTKCHPDCDKKTYVTAEFSIHSALSENDGTFRYFVRFEAVIVYSEYPVFEEQYAQTFLSFLGELGGVLDLWLGISTIAVVHFCFFAVKQVIYMFNKNTKTGTSVRTLIETAKTHHSLQLALTNFLALRKEPKEETPDKIENIETVKDLDIERLNRRIDGIFAELQRLFDINAEEDVIAETPYYFSA